MCIWGQLRQIPGIQSSSSGNEVDPAKIEVIIELPPPKNFQKLKGLRRRLCVHPQFHFKSVWERSIFLEAYEKGCGVRFGSTQSRGPGHIKAYLQHLRSWPVLSSDKRNYK